MSFLGNKNYERKLKEKVDVSINKELRDKMMEVEFLEAMIKELEEQYRIELRKKAISKS